MKLRFRENSLRLRVNRREADRLASGLGIQERIAFPGGAHLTYTLEPHRQQKAEATFQQGIIRVCVPLQEAESWAAGEAIGLYFELPAEGDILKIAIEKDLECVEGPIEERDPEAFPRLAKTC